MRFRKIMSYLIPCFFILLVICLIYNKDYFFQINKVNALSPNITILNNSMSKEFTLSDFQRLKAEYENKDIVGLLKINDTNLKVLVTQATDNNKYLTTNIYGKKDVRGNPFLDYRVDLNISPKILIYGHNSKMYDVPFSELENYYDKDYYEEHQYIDLITEQGLWRYKIFSVYVEASDWYYMNLDFSNQDWHDHLIKLKANSMYDTGETITDDDQILILQTCSYKEEYQDYNKKYLLVIARRVNENE